MSKLKKHLDDLKKFFLKKLYKLLIFKIICIDKTNFTYHDKLKTTHEVEVKSNTGPIKFIFKEDRRKRRRTLDNVLLINNLLVELKVPDSIETEKHEHNKTNIMVIKIIVNKINYSVLAELIFEIYNKAISRYANRRVS